MPTRDYSSPCWEGTCDLPKFLTIAHALGLDVILRPGPYIDAEREMGGLPPWLLTLDPEMKLRTKDPRFLAEVDKWFTVLFEKLRPFSYVENGGPIVMVQVENEYGSYGVDVGDCDVEYLAFLRDKTWEGMGKETFLFTTDGYTLDRIR